MPIGTRTELHEHLALAMRVELATIPLYLYGLYSFEDPASDAALLIRSIVAEEMLHLALAANLLLAVGGDPAFLDASLRPAYPADLPHHEPRLTLHLAPATLEHIRGTFMAIEQPDPPGSPAEPDAYDSLGEFYAAIEEALARLEAAGADLFRDPQLDRQLSDERFYGPVAFDAADSGDLMAVRDLASARAAIEVIVHQGEGLTDDRWADASHQELTHYAKLRQIADGVVPLGRVRPLAADPRSAGWPREARVLADLFNALYAAMFVLLDDLYTARPKKGAAVNRLYATMSEVLPAVARRLTTIPLGDGTFAGPTFEWFDLEPDPPGTLARLAADTVSVHPDLAVPLASVMEGRLLAPVHPVE